LESGETNGVVGVDGVGWELLTSAFAVVRRCLVLRGEVEAVLCFDWRVSAFNPRRVV